MDRRRMLGGLGAALATGLGGSAATARLPGGTALPAPSPLVIPFPVDATVRPGPDAAGAGATCTAPFVKHGEHLPEFTQGFADGVVARRFRNVRITGSQTCHPTRGDSVVFIVDFEAFADGWCATELNAGFLLQFRNRGQVLLPMVIHRMVPFFDPRTWYAQKYALDLPVSVFQACNEVAFVPNPDDVARC